MLLGLLRELNRQYAIHRADEEQTDIRNLPNGQIWPSSRRPAGYNEDFSEPLPSSKPGFSSRRDGPKETDARLERLQLLLKELRTIRYKQRHQSIRSGNMTYLKNRERELSRRIDLIKKTVSPYMYLDLDSD